VILVNDPDFTLHVGDVLDTLRELPGESVHCVVTSPPYWGLRDYGTGQWDGGDPECDHLGEPFRTKATINASCGTGTDRKNAEDRQPMGQSCSKCGATRVDQQLGLEATPDLFVARMVEVFREVRRVLRRDGSCWVNLGDSYATQRNDHAGGGFGKAGGEHERSTAVKRGWHGGPDMKPKDLCGIPWRVAFALQADGWWLRSDIVWSKPNPMPESVTDRPTKAHEYVFLLSKGPRYFFDSEAIREEYAGKTLTHRGGGKAAGKVGQQDAVGKVASGNFGEWDKARTAFPPPRPQEETLDGSDGEAPRGPDGRRATAVKGGDGSIQHRDGERWPNGGRNVRSVWEIATQPYPEAHFATFPEALPERCIKAGTSERGCCPECGAPWVREIAAGSDYPALVRPVSFAPDFGADLRLAREQAGLSQTEVSAWFPSSTGGRTGIVSNWETGKMLPPPHAVAKLLEAFPDLSPKYDGLALASSGTAGGGWMEGDALVVGNAKRGVSLTRDVTTASWRPSCSHRQAFTRGDSSTERAYAPVPCTVLDPFMGSGTTALVARRLGRRSVGIELNPEYAKLCARRLQQLSLFATEDPTPGKP
jgi:site-specific DNA-methyltransferase (cytosine-N4-specific)